MTCAYNSLWESPSFDNFVQVACDACTVDTAIYLGVTCDASIVTAVISLTTTTGAKLAIRAILIKSSKSFGAQTLRSNRLHGQEMTLVKLDSPHSLQAYGKLSSMHQLWQSVPLVALDQHIVLPVLSILVLVLLYEFDSLCILRIYDVYDVKAPTTNSVQTWMDLPIHTDPWATPGNPSISVR